MFDIISKIHLITNKTNNGLLYFLKQHFRKKENMINNQKLFFVFYF